MKQKDDLLKKRFTFLDFFRKINLRFFLLLIMLFSANLYAQNIVAEMNFNGSQVLGESAVCGTEFHEQGINAIILDDTGNCVFEVTNGLFMLQNGSLYFDFNEITSSYDKIQIQLNAASYDAAQVHVMYQSGYDTIFYNHLIDSLHKIEIPVHDGIETLFLRVDDSNVAINSITLLRINIGNQDPCGINLSSNKNGDNNVSFSFDNYNHFSDAQWEWDFGDDSDHKAANQSYASHNYTSAGIYTFCLNLSTPNGICTTCDEVTIEEKGETEIYSYVNSLNEKTTLTIMGSLYSLNIKNATGSILNSWGGELNSNDTTSVLIMYEKKNPDCKFDGYYSYIIDETGIPVTLTFIASQDECINRKNALTAEAFIFEGYAEPCKRNIESKILANSEVLLRYLKETNNTNENWYWKLDGNRIAGSENKLEISKVLKASSEGYQFELIVETDNNFPCVTEKFVYVDPQPCDLDFDWDSNYDIKGQIYFSYYNQNIPNNANIYWNFGNGWEMMNINYPEYLFDKEGTYNVCLKLKTEQDSCQRCKDVYVGSQTEIYYYIDEQNNAVYLILGDNDDYAIKVIDEMDDEIYYAEGMLTEQSSGELSFKDNNEIPCADPGIYKLTNDPEAGPFGFEPKNENCEERKKWLSGGDFIFDRMENGCGYYFDFYNYGGTNQYEFSFNDAFDPTFNGQWYWQIDEENPTYHNKPEFVLDLPNQNNPYSICLTVIANGDTCKTCEQIYVEKTLCEVYLDYEELDDNGNVQLYFDNSQQYSGVANWKWDFGDGTSDIQMNANMPVHKFSEPGIYDICVTVEADGNVCKECMPVVIGDVAVEAEEWSYRKENGNIVTLVKFVDDTYTLRKTNDFGNLLYENYGELDIDDLNGRLKVVDFEGSVCLNAGHYNFKMDSIGNVLSFNVIEDKCEARKELMLASPFRLRDVVSGCNAYFNFEVDGLTVTFNAETKSDKAYYFWDFDDENFSYEKSVTHTFTEAGVYEVCLYIETENGCWDEYCQLIMVGNVELYADFDWDIVEDDPSGLTVRFYNQSFGESSGYWDFGDGNINKDDEFPTHIYSTSGWYEVCANVYNEAGEYDHVCYEIYVGKDSSNCSVKLTYEVIDKIKGVYKFTAMSENANEFQWFMDDGGQPKGETTIYTFNSAGLHEVCIGAWCEETAVWTEDCKEIAVTKDGIAEACNVKIQSTILDPEARTVEFVAVGKGFQDWFWYLGDGETAHTKTIVHTYDSDDIYEVFLFAANEQTYCFDDATKKVVLATDKATEFVNVDFSYAIKDGMVMFTNKTTSNGADYYWTFGDGEMSVERSPNYSYQMPGFYEVCLFAQTNTHFDASCKEIQFGDVNENSEGLCMAAFDMYKNGKEVNFINKSRGKNLIYNWSFGDGTTSTEMSPKHTYTQDGKMEVTLSVYDKTTKCADYDWEVVDIGVNPCKASFEYKVDISTLSVQFKNTSKGANSEVMWVFDDYYETSELNNPLVTFENPGLHIVFLGVYNATTDCYDWIEKEIQVGKVACNAEFSPFIIKNDQNKYVVEFKTEKHTFSNTTEFEWSFGDGSGSKVQKPEYTYDYPGYYYVALETYDNQNGCFDYKEKLILVGEDAGDCEADFKYRVSDNGMKVEFINKSLGNNLSYAWSFGDGTIISESDNPSNLDLNNPVYTYTESGFREVCLLAKDQVSGIENLSCYKIKVGKENDVLAKFEASIDVASRTVKFINKSVAADTYEWKFGKNLSTSTDKEPSFTFPETGHYLINLKASNSTNGKSDKVSALINVGAGDGIAVDFDFVVLPPTNKYGGYPVEMAGAAFGDPAKTVWKFSTGDEIAVAPNTTYVFDAPGIYTVCFDASDPVTKTEKQECKTIEIIGTAIEGEYALQTAFDFFPNPTDGALHLSFELPKRSDVKITMYDMLGKEQVVIADEDRAAGEHAIEWDSSQIEQGVYLIKLQTDYTIKTKRLTIKR